MTVKYERENTVNQIDEKKICENIGMITNNNGDLAELNLVIQDDHTYKFDLREWAPDHSSPGDGISLIWSELDALKRLLNDYWDDLGMLRNVLNEYWDDLEIIKKILNEYGAGLDSLRLVLNQYTESTYYKPVRNPVLQRAFFLAIWYESYLEEKKVQEGHELFYFDTEEKLRSFIRNEYAETDKHYIYDASLQDLFEGIEFEPDFDFYPFDNREYKEYHVQAFNAFNIEEFLCFADEHAEAFSAKIVKAANEEELQFLVQEFNEITDKK